MAMPTTFPSTREHHLPVRRDPFVGGADHSSLGPAFHLEELVVNDLAGLRALGPEVDPVDRAVGVPTRTMMLMVVLFAQNVLHRPIATQRRPAWAQHRIEIDMRLGFVEVVFRERTAVD